MDCGTVGLGPPLYCHLLGWEEDRYLPHWVTPPFLDGLPTRRSDGPMVFIADIGTIQPCRCHYLVGGCLHCRVTCMPCLCHVLEGDPCHHGPGVSPSYLRAVHCTATPAPPPPACRRCQTCQPGARLPPMPCSPMLLYHLPRLPVLRRDVGLPSTTGAVVHYFDFLERDIPQVHHLTISAIRRTPVRWSRGQSIRLFCLPTTRRLPAARTVPTPAALYTATPHTTCATRFTTLHLPPASLPHTLPCGTHALHTLPCTPCLHLFYCLHTTPHTPLLHTALLPLQRGLAYCVHGLPAAGLTQTVSRVTPCTRRVTLVTIHAPPHNVRLRDAYFCCVMRAAYARCKPRYWLCL